MRKLEKNFYKVRVKDEVKLYKENTSYKNIATDFKDKYEYPIVLVMEEGYRLQELHQKLTKDTTLEFVTVTDAHGFEAFRRSMCMLAIKAVHDVSGHDTNTRVRVHFSVCSGYYCTLEGGLSVDQEFLDKVKHRMKVMVAEKIPIEKRSIRTHEAMEQFNKHRMYDKERLLKYRRGSTVNVYNIHEFEDYYYGYMVPDTGYLKEFSLHLFQDGFIIQMPTIKNPLEVPAFKPCLKLFEVRNKSILWGDEQLIPTVGSLNDMIAGSDMREMVLVQEAYHERKIAEIARDIAKREGIKFIMIAGPSSSGKTTFSHRLSVQLRSNGVVPHPIGVDNYYLNRENIPRDADGNYDFECIEAIDVKAFSQDMLALVNGEKVNLPIFDFKVGKRGYDNKYKQLGKHDVLVIEGIHGLNPLLSADLNEDNLYKIYISALTQLKIDEHNMIPSREGRLARRMVRDARTRGVDASGTLGMWHSVKRGEEQFIFPYQEAADVMFNSSLPYELAVLKQYIEPLLFGIEKDDPAYVEARRLLKFFDFFVGIGSENVPGNSLLREFIGGGCFKL